MRVDRRLVSLLLVALAGVSLGVATAWMSDSGTFRYTVTAAEPDDEAERVWICKLAGPPAEPKLAPGPNPRQVGADSVDAHDAFSDAHPSYVVESGEIVCVEPVTDKADATELDSGATGADPDVVAEDPNADGFGADSAETPEADE